MSVFDFLLGSGGVTETRMKDQLKKYREEAAKRKKKMEEEKKRKQHEEQVKMQMRAEVFDNLSRTPRR